MARLSTVARQRNSREGVSRASPNGRSLWEMAAQMVEALNCGRQRRPIGGFRLQRRSGSSLALGSRLSPPSCYTAVSGAGVECSCEAVRG